MPEHLIALYAPEGVDEANAGVIRYRVDNSGIVLVPADVAHELVSVGGFRFVERAPEEPMDLVQIRSTADHGSIGWHGEHYEPNADGLFWVPAPAVRDFVAHGFVAVDPTTVAPPTSPAPEAEAAPEPDAVVPPAPPPSGGRGRRSSASAAAAAAPPQAVPEPTTDAAAPSSES